MRSLLLFLILSAGANAKEAKPQEAKPAAAPAAQEGKPAEEKPATAAGETTSAETAPAEKAPDAAAEEREPVFVIDAGGRWLTDVRGNRATYRSIVNQGEGPR